MKGDVLRCGRLGLHSASGVSERAAIHVLSCAKPMAVCIDPDGRVTVEEPDQAVIDDMVGVYCRMPRVELWLLICSDITAMCRERKLVFGASRRSARKQAQRMAA